MLPNEGKVFNLESALEFMDGDRELLNELALQFLDDVPRYMEELHAALENADAAVVERTAHTLKGSLSTFAAEIATEAALALELIGRGGNLDKAEAACKNLESEIERLKPILSSL